MTLLEAVDWMMKRPGFCATLQGDPIIQIGPTGYLMRRDTDYKAYWKPTAMQCLAITWEVYTAEQLAEASAKAQAELAAQAAEGAGRG